MQDTPDMTTIVFALLAVFLVWKLWSVLGTGRGDGKPPQMPFLGRVRGRPSTPPGESEAKIVPLPGAVEPAQIGSAKPEDRWKGFAEPGSKGWAGLDEIAAADRSFAAHPFLDGAKTAYELIITAFAAGNREFLQGLLSKDVFDSFAAAIADREKRGEKVDTTFVSIDHATIADAFLRGRTAEITVRFNSQLITATFDRDKKLIDGSPDKVVEINDVWTFARDVTSRDPNWRLVATGTAA